jgi:hypothetical protein
MNNEDTISRALAEKISSMTPDQFCRLIIDVCSAYLEKISDPPQEVHEWIWEPGKIPKCPCCGAYSEDGDMGATWCGFCGAKMDGGNEHAADCCG